MSLEDDDDDGQPKTQLSAEEVRAKQLREREEKQRRYDEARAKIFGEPAPTTASATTPTPGNVTPPSDRRGSPRPRGRGRGGRRGREGNNLSTSTDQLSRDSEPRRPANQSGTRELYDPNYSPKRSGFSLQKRGGSSGEPARDESSTPALDYPIREPRGPDGSGRGGFGFASRGGNKS